MYNINSALLLLFVICSLSCDTSTNPSISTVISRTEKTDYYIPAGVDTEVITTFITNFLPDTIHILWCSDPSMQTLQIYKNGTWKDVWSQWDCLGVSYTLPPSQMAKDEFRLWGFGSLTTGIYRFRIVYSEAGNHEVKQTYSNYFRILERANKEY